MSKNAWPPRKKPIVARCFAIALCTWTLLAARARAHAEGGPALSEHEVVAAALGRAALRDTLDGAVELEAGRGHAAAAYPNPRLAVDYERVAGAGETEVSLTQAFELGGQRGLAKRAGAVRVRAVRAQGDGLRAAVATEARRRFYRVLLAQRRVSVFEGWIARLDEALDVVGRRQARGDAPAYERSRLARERVSASGRLAVERAALARAAGQLAALLGDSARAPLHVAGALLPDSSPAAIEALRAAIGARPELRAEELRAEAAALDRAAAARWWAPALELGGGYKAVDHGAGGRADGFVLGVAVAMPLWDRGAGLVRAAAAEARIARGRVALARAEAEAELDGAWRQATELAQAAVELRGQSQEISRDLVRITAAGYAGGELGLLELLDAYRGAAQDELDVLELEHAARAARIELDHLTAKGAP